MQFLYPVTNPAFAMVNNHPTRLFANGPASTLYVTIPAQITTSSRFPFSIDDALTVTIDGDRRFQ